MAMLHTAAGSLFHPMVYTVNTRVLLTELARLYSATPTGHRRCKHPSMGTCLTLEDIPDRYLDWIAQMGFQFIYLLGVWSTGPIGRRYAEMQKQPDCLEEDEICSSPFSVCEYTVNPEFGGSDALTRFRKRLGRRNLGLFLDFVPNHVALDHAWVMDSRCRDFFIEGTEDDLAQHPAAYRRVGGRIIAHGKKQDTPMDQHTVWPDTAQLNYFSANLRKAMIRVVEDIASFCDGVRCDAAASVLSSVFETTWGTAYKNVECANGRPVRQQLKYPEFWPQVINLVLMKSPGFIFLADTPEHHKALMDSGFRYCTDRGLYEALALQSAEGVRRWVESSSVSYHVRMCRYLESHDTARAASMFPDLAIHRAAAVLAYTLPGMKSFHQGQFQGRTLQVPLTRCQEYPESLETLDQRAAVCDMYYRLMDILNHMPVMRSGKCLFLVPERVADDTHQNIVAYIFHDRRARHGRRTPSTSIPPPLSALAGGSSEVLHDAGYCSSDESSSVPHSSAVSETDYDDSEFSLATADEYLEAGGGCRPTRMAGGAGPSSGSRVPEDLFGTAPGTAAARYRGKPPAAADPRNRGIDVTTAPTSPEPTTLPGVPNVSQNDAYQISCNRPTPALVVVNYSNCPSSGTVSLPLCLATTLVSRSRGLSIPSSFPHSAEATPTAAAMEIQTAEDAFHILLREVFSAGSCVRCNLREAVTRGVTFCMQPWQANVFEILLLDEECRLPSHSEP